MEHLANDPACKAHNVTCRACHKKGHYESVCFQKKKSVVKHVTVEDFKDLSTDSSDENEVFVCTVLNNNSNSDQKLVIYCDISINHVPLHVLVDTGSPRTLLNETDFNCIREYCSDVNLCEPRVNLRSYSMNRIDVLGSFKASVSYKDESFVTDIHVVKQGVSILGLDLIHKFKMNIDCHQLQVNHTADYPSSLPADLNEFQDLFSPGLGRVKGFEHKIRVQEDAVPTQAKLRRLPLSVRDAVSAELQKLENEGVIERIDTSPWVSPVVVAWKKSGKIRLCVDLREVNKNIIPDKFPLPTIDDLLSELHGAKYFAKLDLAAAYHQLPLHKDSRDLTAFITHEGLFRYTRVCFGISSAPSAFQKMMSLLLGGMKGVQCYLDDLVIYGHTYEEYKQNLKAVLMKLRKTGLKLNDKCKFDLTSIDFLGHRITQEGLQPSPSQARAILEAPAPHDRTSLRSFLGLVGYYAKFCPDYATVVEPLRALLRGDEVFNWTSEVHESFTKVKTLIGNFVTLTLFDPECDTIVTTDASGYGISGVMSQIHDGKECIVACASRTLTETERKYSVGEREALACVWACERWYRYLWGRHFILRTDHSALTTLLSAKGTGRQTMRIARWNSRLMNFNYTIVHHAGVSPELKIADCLSRLPLPDIEVND